MECTCRIGLTFAVIVDGKAAGRAYRVAGNTSTCVDREPLMGVPRCLTRRIEWPTDSKCPLKLPACGRGTVLETSGPDGLIDELFVKFATCTSHAHGMNGHDVEPPPLTLEVDLYHLRDSVDERVPDPYGPAPMDDAMRRGLDTVTGWWGGVRAYHGWTHHVALLPPINGVPRERASALRAALDVYDTITDHRRAAQALEAALTSTDERAIADARETFAAAGHRLNELRRQAGM